MRRGQDRAGSLYRTTHSEQHRRQPRSGTSAHGLLDSGGPIEFLIPGSGDDYLDLANTMLHVQVKVTRANGDDLDLIDPVGPVNNWLHSLFSQVDVYLNGTLVTPSTNTYAYRAYNETLLSYGTDAKVTQLTGQLWYKDTATHMDSVEIVVGDAANAGFVARRENIVRSRVVDMMGRLHVDLFLQDKFLINGVDVKIRLVRSKAAFALIAGGANPITGSTSSMPPCLPRRPPSIPPCRWHTSRLSRRARSSIRCGPSTARCTPFPRVLGRTRTRTCSSALCKMALVDPRLVLCCIDNDAYNGAYDKNPFHAKNDTISFHAVYVDGRQIPSKPFQPNFADDFFVRSYMSLFSSTGKMWQDEGNGLTRSDYLLRF